jgi:hypothetical protein
MTSAPRRSLSAESFTGTQLASSGFGSLSAATHGDEPGGGEEMQGISTQQLILAWIASALAGALPHLLSSWLTNPRSEPVFRTSVHRALMIFSFGLVLQLAYGAPLYLALQYFGLLSLPFVLVAYVLPVIALRWNAEGTVTNVRLTIQWLLYVSILACVSWAIIGV